MRLSSLFVGAAVLLSPALAGADHPATSPATSPAAHPARPTKAPGTAQLFDIVGGEPNQDDLVMARQVIPPSTPTGTTSTGATTALAQSRIVYLNKNGVTLTPGTNDSRTNRSTIAAQATTIPAWTVSATTWAATVSCMKEIFAPFDIQIVETDPGNVPHIEAVFGGSPGQLGMGPNVAGVSPFTTDCSIIENSIVFTFTSVIPQDARLACEIQAQEVAHSFGLDHELLAADPMTYLNYSGNRSFQNQAAACGESTARACGINGSVCWANQNSVTLLTERLGTSAAPGDTVAPTVGISSPKSGATVPPGFAVSADAQDNIGITMASIYIDGVASGSVSADPYTFTTPVTLPDGKHTIKVEVTDGNNVKATEITVTVKKGAAGTGTGSGDGAGSDSEATDVTGGCAAGGSGAGLLLGFAILGLARVRRRR